MARLLEALKRLWFPVSCFLVIGITVAILTGRALNGNEGVEVTPASPPAPPDTMEVIQPQSGVVTEAPAVPETAVRNAQPPVSPERLLLAPPMEKPGVLHYVRGITMVLDTGQPLTREQHDTALASTYSKDIFGQQVWYTITPTGEGVRQTFAFGRERVYLGLWDLYHKENLSDLELAMDAHGAWTKPADLANVPVSAPNGIYGAEDHWVMRVIHLLPENRPFLPDVPVISDDAFAVETVREIRPAGSPWPIRVRLKGTGRLSEAPPSGPGPMRLLSFEGEEFIQFIGAVRGPGLPAPEATCALSGTWLLDAITGSVIESQVSITGRLPAQANRQGTESPAIRALVVSTQLAPEQFAEQIPAPEAYPHVLGCFPFNGATAIDPALQEFRVYFDKPMYTGHSTFSRRGYEFCLLDSRPNRDWYAARVCAFPMRLESGRQYGITFNPPSFQSFREAKRRLTAPTTQYSFRVAASSDKADRYAGRLALSEEVFLDESQMESVVKSGAALAFKLSPAGLERVASSHSRNVEMRILREDQQASDPLKAAVVVEGRILAYGPVALSDGQAAFTLESEATPEDSSAAVAAIESRRAVALRWVVGEFEPRPLIKLIAEANRPQPFYQLNLPDLPVNLTAERAVAMLQKRGAVLWQQRDSYDKDLLFIGFEQHPVIFSVAEGRCREFPKLFGYDLVRPSAILCLPKEVWWGTDKGLLIWDKESRDWRRMAVGGTGTEANVTDLSLDPDDTIRVLVRAADGAESASLYHPATQQWSNP